MNEAEQDVLGANVVVIEHPGFFLRQDYNPPRPVGEPLEHVIAPHSGDPAGFGVPACFRMVAACPTLCLTRYAPTIRRRSPDSASSPHPTARSRTIVPSTPQANELATPLANMTPSRERRGWRRPADWKDLERSCGLPTGRP